MEHDTWDPQRYATEARFVADLGRSLLDDLNPQAGERVLDLGCGDGVLALELQALGCTVVGIDSSPRQVDAARRKGVNALVWNGHELRFSGDFDAVFSNAALHWMQRPDEVLRGIAAALRLGGRFVAEFGAAGNVAQICGALRTALDRRGISFDRLNPWYFPTGDEYQRKLTAAGFRVESLNVFDRPTPLPGDLVGWLETFARSFTGTLSPTERTTLFEEVRDTLKPTLCDNQGRWTADYVRLRFRAVKA